MREAHLPAQQPEAEEEARLPDPDADARRPRGPSRPADAGSIPPRRLIWRVRRRANFQALAGRRRHQAGSLWLRTAPRGDAGPPAVAYAVGRAVGHAPARNRLRRRLRAAVRAHAECLLDGHDHLLGAGPRAVDLRYAEIEALVHRLLVAANTHSERVTAKSGTKDGPR